MLDRQLVETGFGHINEAAVFANGALQLVAGFDLREKDLPFPYQDLTTKYWLEVLKPKIEK